jgi:hypothetical protein
LQQHLHIRLDGNEAQKHARLKKWQTLIEAGLLDPEDDDPWLNDTANNNSNNTNESGANESNQKEAEKQQEIPANLTPEVLTLPGIKEALFRRAGVTPIEKKEGDNNALNDPSLG